MRKSAKTPNKKSAQTTYQGVAPVSVKIGELSEVVPVKKATTISELLDQLEKASVDQDKALDVLAERSQPFRSGTASVPQSKERPADSNIAARLAKILNGMNHATTRISNITDTINL